MAAEPDPLKPDRAVCPGIACPWASCAEKEVNVLCSKRDLGILSCYLQPRASSGQRLGSSNYPCVTGRETEAYGG